jgi:hypothetical protein
MVAFLFRMPAGIAGEVNRIWASVIEPASITPSGTTGAPTAYGVPLVIDATAGNVGNMRTLLTADGSSFVSGGITYTSGTAIVSGTAGTSPGITGIYPYGILVRPFPTGGSQDPLGTSTPPTTGACDVLKSGYINVILSGSTAAVKGGQVFIWMAAATGTHILGGWEAAPSNGNTIAVPNCYFSGAADAAGNTEIAFNV